MRRSHFGLNACHVWGIPQCLALASTVGSSRNKKKTSFQQQNPSLYGIHGLCRGFINRFMIYSTLLYGFICDIVQQLDTQKGTSGSLALVNIT